MNSLLTSEFLVSDQDPNDTHTFTIISLPSEGIVTNNNDGTFSFDPNDEFNDLALGESRTITFTYTTTDSSGASNATSNVQTVTIEVERIDNNQPTAQVVSVVASQGDSYVNGSFLVTDEDSADTHTFTITSQPTTGVVVNNDDGTFTYTLADDLDNLRIGETRQITFEYEATDNSNSDNSTSDPATITITITGTNDRPVVQDISRSTSRSASITGNFAVTDIDDGDTHTFSIISQPNEGSVVINNDGTFTFNPGNDFNDLAFGTSREVIFTYQAVDNSNSNNATSETGPLLFW